VRGRTQKLLINDWADNLRFAAAQKYGFTGTIGAVAKDVGFTFPTVSTAFRGDWERVSLEVVVLLAHHLGVQVMLDRQ